MSINGPRRQISSNGRFYQRMSSFNVFQINYQASNRMRYWQIFNESFEKFQKLKFNCEVEMENWRVAMEKNIFCLKISAPVILSEGATFWDGARKWHSNTSDLEQIISLFTYNKSFSIKL